MFDLHIELTDISALLKVDTLDAKIDKQVRIKVEAETERLREKVVENLSGRILKTQSGRLAGSVVSHVTTGSGEEGYRFSSRTVVGTVEIEDTDPKVYAYGMAHEYGGKGSYSIIPINKRFLVFELDGKNIFTRSVVHPGAKENSFMRLALRESREHIISSIEQGVNEAIRS